MISRHRWTAALVAAMLIVEGVGAQATQEERPRDPFASLVDRLQPSQGRWVNGVYPQLDLLPSASPDEVVTRLFEVISFTDGNVTEHKIVETRPLVVPPQRVSYTAALVDTNLGRKLVLMRLDADKNWWTRVFDASE